MTSARFYRMLASMDSFDFYNPTVLSVGQLMRRLREVLEEDPVMQDVWVQGEISNLSKPASGHLYFTLKDSEASVRCVMWKGLAQRVPFTPRDGMAVEAHGSMNVFEAGGQVQLYIDNMRPAGEGALYLEFLRLKALLEGEGLFEESHKRPIPELPHTIGVVTSATGAAVQDIFNTLRRRLPLAKVYLAATAVQGVDAPDGIVNAITLLNEQVQPDVIIVARGGGSIEDLWAFNDEKVARAIFASKAPVITGVGHETDFTIADFVADLRAPTPTAAAELATTTTILDLQDAVDAQFAEVITLVEQRIARLKQELLLAESRLKQQSPRMLIYTQRQYLDEQLGRCGRALDAILRTRKLETQSLHSRLVSLNPQAVLKRGYAIITRDVDHAVVSKVSQAVEGDRVHLQISDGSLPAVITPTEQEKKRA